MGPPTKVVLVACGSFNPITNMHLRIFEVGRDYLHRTGRYQVVGGIISPVHDDYKKKDLQPAKHRCAMIQRALKSSNWIRLDTWESEQQTWTETKKVLTHHWEALNNNGNPDEVDNICNMNETVAIKLLCGADVLESFSVPGLWKDEDIEEIVGRFGIVVITREGSNPLKFIYESDVLTQHQSNIYVATEWIRNETSATKIRRALSRGESVKYLIPDEVISYIQQNTLYQLTNK
jgi:nicotinamide mononucleotide adenylyltransferase